MECDESMLIEDIKERFQSLKNRKKEGCVRE